MICTEPLLLEIAVSGGGVRISNAGDFNREVRTQTKGKVGLQIYIIFAGRKVVYVGECKNVSKSITRRRARKGYTGYKWLDREYLGEEIRCLVFPLKKPSLKKEYGVVTKKYIDRYKRFREAVEAEVVYYLRAKFGEWPSSQNEIHFYEGLREDVNVRNAVSRIEATLERLFRSKRFKGWDLGKR